MGLFDSNDRRLPMRVKAALRAAARASAVRGGFGAFLPMRIPTVGLHDKTRDHRDSPALRGAKDAYAKMIPPIPAPVAGPLELAAAFVLEPPVGYGRFDGFRPHGQAPDLSNLVKVFEDALRLKGWMVDDAAVVSHRNAKWCTHDRHLQGVWFTLATIEAPSFDPDGAVPGARVAPGRRIRLWVAEQETT